MADQTEAAEAEATKPEAAEAQAAKADDTEAWGKSYFASWGVAPVLPERSATRNKCTV